MDPSEEDVEMDDAELQMALMLSMQQAQPDDPQPESAPAAPAPAPAAMAAPPVPVAPAPAVNAASLQQALLQAMQVNPAHLMAAQAQQLEQQQQQQQQQQQGAAVPRAPQQPVAASTKLPSWVQPAQNWVALNERMDGAVVTREAVEGGTGQKMLLKALGTPVNELPPAAVATPVSAAPSSSTPSFTFPGSDKQYRAVSLPLTPDPAGFKMAASVMTAFVGNMQPGADLVLAMQAYWLRAADLAAGADASTAGAVPVLRLLQACVAQRAMGVLQDDEDDLFFEGGKARATLLAALAAGQVTVGFIDAMAACAFTAEDGRLWEGLLKDAFAAVKSFNFAAPEDVEGALRRLDVLTQGPTLRRCLASMLVGEAARAGRNRQGKALQAESVLAPLLALSPLPTFAARSLLPLTFPAKEGFMQLRNYPRNRGSQVESEIASIRRAQARLHAAAHEICHRVATLKPPAAGAAAATAARGREVMPAWLSAVAVANVARARAGSYVDRVLHDRRAVWDCSSDGFLHGTLAVGLLFCRRFLKDAAGQQAALQHLRPSFYTTQCHRLGALLSERTLGGTLRPLPPGAAQVAPAVSPDRAESEVPHFIAEMFFATQQLMHVGLVPTIYRSQALAKLLKERRGRQGEEEEDGMVDESVQGASEEEWLLADSMRAALLEPDSAALLVEFCELTARWILSILQQGPGPAREALVLIPESALRDICAVLNFLIRQRATELLGGMDIGALVGCLTAVLRATDLIPSPAVHFSVVQLLLGMLSPQLGAGRHARSGSYHLGAAEAALVSAVLGTGAAQTELLPALMAAYVHADHVVGLDVDKDQYDKFHMRTCVDLLLMELWRDPTCAASLDSVASDSSDLFPDFCGAVLSDLLYLLKDSLGRLEDIAQMEGSMADTAAWAAQPAAQRADKEAFLQSQQRAAGGFMSQAVTTLRMLNALAASRSVQRAFADERVVHRAAGAGFHFLDLLVGARGVGLGVQRPEQYGFDPDALLLGIVQFTLRLAQQPAFVPALASVPDFDDDVMKAAVEALRSRQIGEYEHRSRLEGLIAAAAQARRGGSSAAGPSSSTPNGQLDLSLPGEDPGAGLDAAYAAALTPLALGEFDSSLPRAYNRHFAAMASAAAGDESKKVRRVGREFRDMRGKMALPVYAAGAILVRHDADRLDKARALLTGPEGTPYAGGCYFFDVYFPSDYPQVPPLLEMETTGGGVWRANPNLYSDGKVCLSLLGTWHGGHESEKWNPQSSSLWQVLVSIQSQILIEAPYFNEPSYDAIKGTSEGAAASLRYNAEIWLGNIRYAMLDVLRNPRPGYEQAIAIHFRLLRHRIMRQAGEWLEAAKALDETYQRRLGEAVGELHGLLAVL